MPAGDKPEYPQESKSTVGAADLSLLKLSPQPILSKNNELLVPNSVSGIRNAATVYGQVIAGAPGAVLSQLKEDCSEHTGATLLRVAESAAFGFGSAVILARSPVLAKTLLSMAGLGASAYMAGSTARFTSEAFHANSNEAQSRLSASALDSIGKFGAAVLETSPGLLAGTISGAMLRSRIGTLDKIASSVRDHGEYAIRNHVPERFHYISLDAKTINNLGSKGELNLLRAGEQMMKETPWRGIEEGRFFKAAGDQSIKMSARLPGSKFETIMGRRSEAMFHTHAENILPTSGDFNSVFGTGVIGVPKSGILTFYEGTGKQAQSLVQLMKAGKMEEAATAMDALHGRSFKSLVMDPAKKLSVRVDLRWNGTANRMEAGSIQALDYSSTIKNLSNWQGRLNIEAIQSSSEALLKPGMTDLLRKIASDSGI